MGQYNFVNREGSTPLDENQTEGLKFSHITTMSELDEVEDINIQKGLEWLNAQKTIDFSRFSDFTFDRNNSNGCIGLRIHPIRTHI